MIIFLILTGWHAHTLLQDLQQTHKAESSSDRLYQTLLKMQRYEKGFLARKELKYQKYFNEAFEVFEAEDGMGPTINPMFTALSNQVRFYHTAFNRMVQQSQRIGLNENQGLHGNLRESAHILEKALSGNDHYQADLLMLRRHEKDFFQRRDTKYVQRFKVAYADLQEDMQGDPEATLFLPVLRDYLSAFLTSVSAHITIGLTRDQGIRGEARRAAHEMESLVKKINQLFHLVGKTHTQNIYRTLSLLGILFSLSLVAGIMLISRWILGKTNRVTHGIKLIQQSDCYNITLPVQGHDEFATITLALNDMVAKVNDSLMNLQSIMDHTPHGIWLTDEKGKAKFVNGTLCHLLDVNKAALINHTFVDQLFGRQVANEFSEARKAGPLESHLKSSYATLPSADNSRYHEFKITQVKILNDAGEIAGFIGIVEDITELNSLQSQVIQMQKMEALGTLSGGIAHDFNNLLAIIATSAELALAMTPSDDPRNRMLTRIMEASQRGVSMVKGMLRFARKEAVKQELINPNKLISGVLDLATETFGSSILIEQEIEPNLLSIQGDHSQLHQVLLNLLVNARDAVLATQNGTIVVAASNILVTAENDDPCPYLCIEVRDNGYGIPKSLQKRIFEPFFTTKPAGAGTGLGLSTVYGIVSSHHGEIDVESSEGVGTQFRVSIPQVNASSLPEPETDNPQHHALINGNILIVEDERLLRETIVEYLKQGGGHNNIVETTNGQQAWQWLQENDSPDLIILDAIMPKMSGLEVLAHIKRTRPDIPVIIMSGNLSASVVKQGGWPGHYGFLEKPFSLTQLSEEIACVLASTGGSAPPDMA